MRTKKTLSIALAVILTFIALGSFFVGSFMKIALLDVFLSLTPAAPILPEANILVLGIDQAGSIHRSDTIMVMHVNPAKKETSIISIPRDTLVAIPGRGLDKINHAYAFGGIELAKKTAENFLHASIPYYVMVDLHGIEKLVDDLGGIVVNVEKRMYYIDYAGDLNIDLQPGVQKLNGHQAMGYLRFRHTDNDFSRIGRQQNFLQMLIAQLMSKENVIKSPAAFFALLDCVDSNLNAREILGLSLTVRSAFESGRMTLSMLPGTDLMVDGMYYLRPDEALMQKLLEPYRQNGPLASSEIPVRQEN